MVTVLLQRSYQKSEELLPAAEQNGYLTSGEPSPVGHSVWEFRQRKQNS